MSRNLAILEIEMECEACRSTFLIEKSLSQYTLIENSLVRFELEKWIADEVIRQFESILEGRCESYPCPQCNHVQGFMKVPKRVYFTKCFWFLCLSALLLLTLSFLALSKIGARDYLTLNVEHFWETLIVVGLLSLIVLVRWLIRRRRDIPTQEERTVVNGEGSLKAKPLTPRIVVKDGNGRILYHHQIGPKSESVTRGYIMNDLRKRRGSMLK